MPSLNPYTYSIKLLARQDYSKAKLRQKLRLKKFENKEIESTLEELMNKGYLNEESYARGRLRFFFRKGYSPRMAQRYLEEENVQVSFEFVTDFFSELGFSEETQVEKIIQKTLLK